MPSSKPDTFIENGQISYSTAHLTPPSSTLKRRSEDANDIREKRQRMDYGPTDTNRATYDMAAILAQAAASAAQSLDEGMGPAQEEAETSKPEVQMEQPMFMSDPHLSMRILSLPVLESLVGTIELPEILANTDTSKSTQILSILAQGPYSETIRIVTEPNSDIGQAYATLKKLFDETKKMYSRQAPFLSADELEIKDPEHRATIRTTNLATFVASVFGGQDVGFYELNDHFIETFTPDGQTFKRVAGELFLNLKTQMYLSAVSQEEQESTKEDLLEDLFPANLEQTLASRHSGTPLSQSELNFFVSSNARREFLGNQPSDADSIQVLSEKFAWEDFLRSLSVHLGQTYLPLLSPYMRRHSLTASAPVPISYQNGAQSQTNSDGDGGGADARVSVECDLSALAEQAAQEALQAYGQDHQPSYSQQNSESPQNQYGTNGSEYNSNGLVPFPTQTQPTRVLYEKARQAAVAKSAPTNARRPGLPSQRRPWSTEEENALMAGLDAVKGPHWSQILMLYGSKGSVNDLLKDRNQVQLKDKARNLKLFFLKSGIEVPYYLQSVTGELKTRAPTQAARREQEERTRLGGDDERARFDGILTLSQGLSNPQAERYSEEVDDNVSYDENSPEQFQAVEPDREEEPHTRPHMREDDDQYRQPFMALGDKAGTTTNVAA